jgi:hydrogenase nickel incorporation protein HypA/HybF
MHELAISETVVETVSERLPGSLISCVHLEVGALSGVVTDSLRFCFDMVTEGTNLEGARLEITQPPARCRCHECGSEFEPEDTVPVCPCGSADVLVISGAQLRIVSVQVAA